MLYSHPALEAHDTGPRHPERPARVRAAVAGARTSGVELIERVPPAIEEAALSVAHDPVYIARIQQFCREGGGPLDADTFATLSDEGYAMSHEALVTLALTS